MIPYAQCLSLIIQQFWVRVAISFLILCVALYIIVSKRFGLRAKVGKSIGVSFIRPAPSLTARADSRVPIIQAGGWFDDSLRVESCQRKADTLSTHQKPD